MISLGTSLQNQDPAQMFEGDGERRGNCIDASLTPRSTRVKRLGVPQESRDAFAMICAAGIIDNGLRDNMQAMVGFRNIAVHD